jgi:hypothetical protein
VYLDRATCQSVYEVFPPSSGATTDTTNIVIAPTSVTPIGLVSSGTAADLGGRSVAAAATATYRSVFWTGAVDERSSATADFSATGLFRLTALALGQPRTDWLALTGSAECVRAGGLGIDVSVGVPSGRVPGYGVNARTAIRPGGVFDLTRIASGSYSWGSLDRRYEAVQISRSQFKVSVFQSVDYAFIPGSVAESRYRATIDTAWTVTLATPCPDPTGQGPGDVGGIGGVTITRVIRSLRR